MVTFRNVITDDSADGQTVRGIVLNNIAERHHGLGASDMAGRMASWVWVGKGKLCCNSEQQARQTCCRGPATRNASGGGRWSQIGRRGEQPRGFGQQGREGVKDDTKCAAI